MRLHRRTVVLAGLPFILLDRSLARGRPATRSRRAMPCASSARPLRLQVSILLNASSPIDVTALAGTGAAPSQATAGWRYGEQGCAISKTIRSS